VTHRAGTRTAIAATIAAFSSLVLAGSGLACGFHGDPSVGALNAAYPKALWVRTAVWQAQLDGEIVGPSAAVPGDAFAARVALARRYRAASDRFGALRDSLDAQRARHGAPPFTVLLIGPMLWSRFAPAGDGYRLQVHAEGAAAGDVVLITDEPVLAALADGKIGFSRARDLGLVRLYGKPSGVSAVTAAFQAWRPVPPDPKPAS